jgi:catalase
VNYPQIPVNAPKCPVNGYHRDGMNRIDGNAGGIDSHTPNTVGAWQDQLQCRRAGGALERFVLRPLY